ncbi:MAG: GNAT family N-acetyltransferase [Chloroflexi bacterium]|nr:MAG: GNAT family N-acetyltransferase [Chloroflexota bacterium]
MHYGFILLPTVQVLVPAQERYRQRIEYFDSMQEIEEIAVRPFSSREEYELMLDYFYNADDSFLRGMGVDRLKLPPRDKWLDALLTDHEKADTERDRFYLVWIFRGRRVGHSSINNIAVGTEAFIHLHLWNSQLRRAGLGTEFVRRSASFYFERFNLKRLVCEPWAGNLAPNRVLEKLGFAFVGRYRTAPGVIAYEQDVNRYELRSDQGLPASR